MPKSPRLTVTLAGQSMIRGDIRVEVPEAVPVIRSLVTGDVAFTNFEAAVFDPAQGQSYRDGRFAAPASSMAALQSFGFNALSLSNNHSFDIKVPGILNTLQAAERLEMAHAGAGHNISEASEHRILETKHGKIALVAFASGLVHDGRATDVQPGINELRLDGLAPNADDAQRILESVRNARKAADIVIVSQHNHLYSAVERPADFKQLLLSQLPVRLAPPEWMKPWARQLVDAGADVLAIHGPPFMHGIEIYKGKPIFYSLGNFIFQVPPESIHLEEPIMWESVVADVEFEGNKPCGIRLQPIAMNKVGRGLPNPHDEFDVNQYHRTRGLPKPATGKQAQYLLERLVELSGPFGTSVEIEGETARIRLTDPH